MTTVYTKPTRAGRFAVSPKFIDDAIASMDTPIPGVNLFDGMIIIRAEYDPYTDKFIYFALHPDFEPIMPGCVAPEYIAEFREGETKPHWKKTGAG